MGGARSEADGGAPDPDRCEEEARRLDVERADSWEASIALAAARARMFGAAGPESGAGRAVEQLFDEGAIVPTLERYVVLERLGRGGMGDVFRAYDPKLRREVAVKMLRHRPDAEASARMVREAQAMAKLRHPNVVAVFDVEAEHDPPFITMELVEGVTLRAWLDSENRPLPTVIDAIHEAGRGLAAAHGAGLVHRDFKPDNVLVDRDGRPRVLDFGLARGHGDPSVPTPASMTDASLPELTAEGTVLGTPAYMAPEQHRGEPPDHRCDQFALCAVLYEAVTRERAFGARTAAELYMAKRQGANLERLPAELRAVVRRGLSFDVIDRFPSMDALLRELRSAPAQRRSRARKRLVAGVVVAGGIALGVGSHAQQWRDEQRRRECTAAADGISETWGTRARNRLESSILSTGLPYAPEVAHNTLESLDRYTGRWHDAFTAKCVGAPGPSQDFVDPCLAARRMELEILVEHLTLSDEGVARVAAGAASGLTPVAACDAPEATRYMSETQDGRRAQRSLYTAMAARAVGEHERAIAELRGALQTQTPPTGRVSARLRLELGLTLFSTGEYEASLPLLEASYFEAQAANGYRVAVRAAAGLVSAHVRLGHPTEAAQWAAHGQVIADQREVSEAVRLHLASEQAAAAASAGRMEEAARLYADILARRRDLNGSDHATVGAALHNLATIELQLGHLERAGAMFEQSVAIQRARLGGKHPNVALALTNLGTVHRQNEDYARAEATHREALSILRADPKASPFQVAANLSSLAMSRYYQGAYDDALALLDESLELATDAYGPRSLVAVSAELGRAMVFASRGEEVRAREVFDRAIAGFGAGEGATQLSHAEALALAGRFELERGDLDAASDELRRAMEIFDRLLGPHAHQSRAARAGLAELALRRGDTRRAIDLAEPLVQGERFDEMAAEAHFVLAQALWDTDPTRARKLAIRAREYASNRAARPRQRAIETWLAAHGT